MSLREKGSEKLVKSGGHHSYSKPVAAAEESRSGHIIPTPRRGGQGKNIRGGSCRSRPRPGQIRNKDANLDPPWTSAQWECCSERPHEAERFAKLVRTIAEMELPIARAMRLRQPPASNSTSLLRLPRTTMTGSSQGFVTPPTSGARGRSSSRATRRSSSGSQVSPGDRQPQGCRHRRTEEVSRVFGVQRGSYRRCLDGWHGRKGSPDRRAIMRSLHSVTAVVAALFLLLSSCKPGNWGGMRQEQPGEFTAEAAKIRLQRLAPERGRAATGRPGPHPGRAWLPGAGLPAPYRAVPRCVQRSVRRAGHRLRGGDGGWQIAQVFADTYRLDTGFLVG